MKDLIILRIKNAEAKNPGTEELIIKEIIQEIALLGLWRAKFFEHSAFYGGTALKLFYGLNRFSEDLDFTLLKKKKDFGFGLFCGAVKNELESFGFSVDITEKKKGFESQVQSAFIKTNTQATFISVGSKFSTYKNAILKVKIEIDTDGTPGFNTEAKQLFWPQPYSVVTCDLPSLLSGKLHAMFCREMRKNVKGRDWYDFLWFIGQGVKPNWVYLKNKLLFNEHWPKNIKFTPGNFIDWAYNKISSIDIDMARKDVERFIEDKRQLETWNKQLFMKAIKKLT